ncbi:MAG: hypothetical protein RI995_286 [Bacteroidota bacterium]|jgi:nitrite reductase/ring-hydroxylating ferredoxin subunit
MQEKIKRNEFLKSLGFKGGALLALYCTGQGLSSCSADNTVVPASVDLSLDLSSASNAALGTTGGYVISSNVVVANVGNGNYVAASITCPHENKNAIRYTQGVFYCPEHGATFSTNGTCTNGVTGKALKIYTVTKNGTTLTIK